MLKRQVLLFLYQKLIGRRITETLFLFDISRLPMRFQNCSNAWTSMKGRVMFWIYLDAEENLGGVLFKLYGQACDKCANDEDCVYCPAMWYPEEVVKVSFGVYASLAVNCQKGYAIMHCPLCFLNHCLKAVFQRHRFDHRDLISCTHVGTMSDLHKLNKY